MCDGVMIVDVVDHGPGPQERVESLCPYCKREPECGHVKILRPMCCDFKVKAELDPKPLVKDEVIYLAAYREANAVGYAAGVAKAPRPMVVGQPTDPLGNDIDFSKTTYFVPDGVCGFAWVNVKPGTSSFAKFLVKRKLGSPDSYYGGVTIWISEHGQSYERKLAHASAMATVLRRYGVKAYASGRLD